MTAPDARIAAAFGLDETGWARHANPLSGWSRVLTGLPLIVLALWSAHWIGWWAAVPVALTALWLKLNPRAFPPARDDTAWISRAVIGERLWIARGTLSLPDHHVTAARATIALSLLGLPPLVYGLWTAQVWPTLTGALLAWIGKMWFIDRMAWLYDDMVRIDPTLRYTGPPQS